MISAILLAAAVPVCIDHVHDGDTLTLCTGEKIRIENIDAPELRGSPSCRGWKARTHWCDYALGERAAQSMRAMLGHGRVTIIRSGTDRYGRTLAKVRVNGRDAGDMLIGMGLARRWR